MLHPWWAPLVCFLVVCPVFVSVVDWHKGQLYQKVDNMQSIC